MLYKFPCNFFQLNQSCFILLFHAYRTAPATITEASITTRPALNTAQSTTELSFKNNSKAGVELGQLLSTHIGSSGHPYRAAHAVGVVPFVDTFSVDTSFHLNVPSFVAVPLHPTHSSNVEYDGTNFTVALRHLPL